MANPIRIRVRGPEGIAVVTIDGSATWSDLLKEITDKTGVRDFDLKYGYPPQPFPADSILPETKLSDLPHKLHGEQLIINPLTSQPAPPIKEKERPISLTRKPQTDIQRNPPEVPIPQLNGAMILRVMPDDNSCLFRALSSALLGSQLDGATELRSMVAQTIQASPDQYNAAILEKEPDEYCRWIQREDSWGGGIEMEILAQYFGVEICSVDVKDLQVYRFNEGRGQRCLLVYSGIHYDLCALADHLNADPEYDKKLFSVERFEDGGEDDLGVLEAAKDICKELRRQKYYTDTQKFVLRCNVCGASGSGEKWAVEHMKATGHSDLSQES